jgi:hypothetical protein
MDMPRGDVIVKRETELVMRDGAKVATDGPVRCPKCRRAISPESFDCPYCGAPVAFIWEDCRVACYLLRLAAVFLLASLIAGVIAIVVTDTLGMTGLGVGNVAIVSAIIAVIAIGLWKLGDALSPPPGPHREFRDGRIRS